MPLRSEVTAPRLAVVCAQHPVYATGCVQGYCKITSVRVYRDFISFDGGQKEKNVFVKIATDAWTRPETASQQPHSRSGLENKDLKAGVMWGL